MVCLALLLLASISMRWFVVVPCCVAEENDNVLKPLLINFEISTRRKNKKSATLFSVLKKIGKCCCLKCLLPREPSTLPFLLSRDEMFILS